MRESVRVVALMGATLATLCKGAFAEGTRDGNVQSECVNVQNKSKNYYTLKLFPNAYSSPVFHEFLGHIPD